MKIAFYVIILLALLNGYGWYRNRQTLQDPREKLFQKGNVPTQEPNGFHERNMPNYTGAWQGKQFDPQTDKGVNIFLEDGRRVEKYPFRTYSSGSLGNPVKQVYRIDYNIVGNPIWLRTLVDEIVQQSDQTLTGKIFVHIGWMKFAVGWFSLK